MLYPRIIFAGIAALFYVVLGTFALIRNPRHPLNRSFAFFQFGLAIWIIGGFALLIENHHLGVLLYKCAYMAGPVALYFCVAFIQHLLELYDQPFYRQTRRLLIIFTLIVSPLHMTSLFIKDFKYAPGQPVPFHDIAGPLFPTVQILFGVVVVYLSTLTALQIRKSIGYKRNHLKFVLLAGILGVITIVLIVLRSMSFLPTDPTWTYFSFQMASNFCFAYIIFKYQLFDFNLWMRRAAIFCGIYAFLIGLPLFLTVPLHSLSSRPTSEFLWALPLGIVLYGILFSLAPALNTFLRDKSEQKIWTHLHTQLAFIREASEHLGDESNRSITDCSNKLLNILKEFFWNRLKTPLRNLFIIGDDQKGSILISALPDKNVNVEEAREFLDLLKKNPSLSTKPYFSRMDVNNMASETHRANSAPSPATLYFLNSHNAEYCLPCHHDGKIFGALVLGPKQKGIFDLEELSVLQTAAHQFALAIRKFELISLTQHLYDLDQYKKDLISHITHELKGPLYNINNSLEIVREELEKASPSKKSMGEFIDIAQKNTDRLDHSVQSFLEISKLEKPKLKLQPEPCRIGKIVTEVIEFLRPLSLEKDVAVNSHIPDSLTASLDPEKAHQVFSNIVSNAVKFTSKGRVDVISFQSDDKIRIQVKDTGRGIDPKDIDSIFEPFFQVPDAEQSTFKGTGLGLTIAKGWTEAHGGRIWAESDGLGRGTTVTVEFPIPKLTAASS